MSAPAPFRNEGSEPGVMPGSLVVQQIETNLWAAMKADRSQIVGYARTEDEARLFAAAPDLLALSARLLSLWDEGDTNEDEERAGELQDAWDETLCALRAAISAARGEVPA